ncbi:flagellar basal-body MS-ring/collar protein FliF [Salinicola salarius]|uniref:flagellar basal-body MS-ring/collar protein FliF n=1 Tax=Salinicola salarius TaxID=430457 RepID=UPI000DA23650|nr:flagellar basal-body MS-ring/collar protein FliF [Salinicola salarius]MDF3917568.1 flagellar basal-body MS-ring/collar protein FliF [Salinicola salarius]
MSTATSSNDAQNSANASARNSNRQAASETTSGGRDWLNRLQRNPRIPLIVAGAAAVAIVIALLLWARSPEYRVLYSTLTDADGGRIITQLDTMGIPYEFSEGGQALLVPADQVRQTRLRLAEQGLPEASGVGFELMDDQAFGISQFAEQVNYQRALEGELARTIGTLGSVERARVHLAMAKPSVFVRESEPASASVVLDLQPGRVLGEGQVNAIVHMVSSSVPQLAIDDVTVIDQNGDLLSRSNRNNNQLDGSQLDYVNNLEDQYAQRIEAILAPIVGARNVRAQVTAQIDFSQREQTAERYGPNQAPNEAAVRSQQTSSSYQSNGDLAMGVPGALSNQPPGVAASPINAQGTQAQTDGADDADNADNQNADTQGTETADTTDTGRARHDSTINYEVDRTVEHVKEHSGDIERLSAAIVVNYRDGVDEDGNPTQVALSDTEMEQIRGLVRQAMGFSAARGDALEVVNSPFQIDAQDFDTLPWWQTPEVWSLGKSVLKYLVVALVALFLWFKVVKPLLRRQTAEPAPAPVAAPTPATGAAAAAGAASYQAVSDSGVSDEPVEGSRRERSRRGASSYEQDLKEVREIAQEDPRLVAMVVRSWMDKS